METRKRTHLVNELMEEAGLMMRVLQKAMAGQQAEADYHEGRGDIPADAPHAPPACSLEDEYAAWERICAALHQIQAELDQIAHAEQERLQPSTSERMSSC